MNNQKPAKVPEVTFRSGMNLDNETVAQLINVISMLRDNQLLILKRLNELEELVLSKRNQTDE